MKSTNVEKVLEKIRTPVLGVGVTAFNRLGPELFLGNYRIFCLSFGQDLSLIEKDVPVFSIERRGGFSGLKNSSSVMENRLVQEEIRKVKNPYLLFYMPNEKIGKICRKHGWEMIGQAPPEEIMNKALFRGFLGGLGIPLIPGEETVLTEDAYPKLKEKYGSFVAQLPEGSGGKSTRFIHSEQDFEQARKMAGGDSVIVSRFIRGPSPSITGCVTKYGILYTNLQYQLLDIPECVNPAVGSGIFCGHDWTLSSFDLGTEQQAYDYVRKVGGRLKEMGYRGIFGLDLVLDRETQRLYIVECNPRLLGSFPALTMVQRLNREPLIIAFHVAEFLGLEYMIDVEKVNREMKGKKKGAHLILYNKLGVSATNREVLKPGIYAMEGGSLVYKRPGYRLCDLKGGDEFAIADDVPFENSVFKPHERILRLMTLHPMMDVKSYKLNEWARMVVEKVYSALRLEPLETSLTKS